MNLKPIWEHEFYIGAYDVNTKGEIKLSKLTGYIQETAWWHATHLKLGADFLHKEKMVWMLSAIKIHIDYFPRWMEKINIETWSKGINRLFYLRDFLLYDAAGNIFGMASSQWLLLDMKSLRPKIKETKELLSVIDPDTHVFEEQIQKLPGIENGEQFKRGIDYTDFDLNHHVNSNRYIDFILGTFVPSFHHHKRVEDFQLNFIKEVKDVNEIMLQRKNIDNDSMFRIDGTSINNEMLYFQSFIGFTESNS